MGTVVMADSTALPPDMIVQLVCHGRVMDESQVSPRGGFSLEAGEDPLGASDLDASVQGHPNSPQIGAWPTPHDAPRARSVLNGCQVRLAPGLDYSSNEIPLDNIDLRSKPDVGTLIVRRGSSDGEITAIDISQLKIPSKARKEYEKAQKELAKEKVKYPKAIEYLEAATKEFPEFTDAWYLLGYCLQVTDDQQGAKKAFEETVRFDRNHKGANFELARYELDAGSWVEASRYTRLLVQLEPDQPQVLYFDGVANFNSGQQDLAQASLSHLVALGHSEAYPMALFFLAVIEGDQRNYAVAADYLTKFLETAPEESVPDDLRKNAEQHLKMWQEKAEQKDGDR
jgi:Tfp pilus assembly protein PilF